ncbi:MAG: ABC transporter ATP-binding protein [Phycisphaerales bacterium]|nr:ABC transporter ATP-binding protein [Phycisphaerales bacterium]
METVLSVRRVGRRFGDVEALKDVSLEVRAGEIVGLLGPNGAGKTTLLRVVLGLITASCGEVRVLGKLAREVACAGGGEVASVGEGYEPLWTTTLRLLEGLQSEASPHFERTAFRAWCESKGLARSKRFGELSKGQKRWVMCGLAMAARPRLMLLDEPADGLDPAARRTLYEALRHHANEHGTAILITTHLLGDIERVADHVVILDRGLVKLSAALEDLREEVREVEMPLVGVEHEVLARDGRRAWVRLPKGVEMGRTVGLEDLYLALTGSVE